MIEDRTCDECDNEIEYFKDVMGCLSCGAIICKSCGFIKVRLPNGKIVKGWWCPICGDVLHSLQLCEGDIEELDRMLHTQITKLV
jgi:hypothetical protein